jgi:hypothetical protein
MIWIAVVAGLACLVIPLLVRARQADDGEDYGTVSGAWIAEHRVSDEDEAYRDVSP